MKAMTPTLTAAVVLVAFVAISTLSAQEPEEGTPPNIQTETFQVGPARSVNMRQLPELTQENVPPIGPVPEYNGITDAEYLKLKEKAGLPGGASAPSGQPLVEPLPPSTISSLFTPSADVNLVPPDTVRSTDACATTPPDMALAANQNFVVQLVNRCITILNTATGRRVSQRTLNTFFGVAANHNVGDPRALYDSRSQRFIIIAEDFTAGPPNQLLFATSAGNDPTGDWQLRTFDMNMSNCADFPTLGQTLQEGGDPLGAIYVGFNAVNCNPPGALLDDVVWVFPKTPAYAGNAMIARAFFGFTDSNGLLLDTLQPANVMNKYDRPRVEFLLNTYDLNGDGTAGNALCANGCRGLFVWAIYNGVPATGQMPQLTRSMLNTLPYRLAPVARQRGCAADNCRIDTGKTKISATVNYSSGELFAVTTTRNNAATPGSTLLWWDVHPTLDDTGTVTAVLRSQDCFFCNGFGSNGSAYYGAIQPDSENNFTMVYDYSSDMFFPSLIYSTRRVTQLVNTMHDIGITLDSGTGPYVRLVNGRNRWGDYTATAPYVPGRAGLPDSNAYWFSGQFSQAGAADAVSIWGSAIGRNGYTSPNQP